jgi:hypothetical protein
VERVSTDPKKSLDFLNPQVEASTLPKGSISTGLGVPGLSVLRDLDSPADSEKEPDLFLAACMGTFSVLLLDIKEDIVLS